MCVYTCIYLYMCIDIDMYTYMYICAYICIYIDWNIIISILGIRDLSWNRLILNWIN